MPLQGTYDFVAPGSPNPLTQLLHDIFDVQNHPQNTNAYVSPDLTNVYDCGC